MIKYYNSSNVEVGTEQEARAAGGYVVYDAGGTNPVRVDLVPVTSLDVADGGKFLGTFDPTTQTFNSAFVAATPPAKPGDYFRVTTAGPDSTPFTGVKLYPGDELVAKVVSDPLTASSDDWAVRRGSFVPTAAQENVDDVISIYENNDDTRYIWTPQQLQDIQRAGDLFRVAYVPDIPDVAELADFKEGDRVIVRPGSVLSGMMFQHAGSFWAYLGQSQIPVVNYNIVTSTIAAVLSYPQLFYWIRIDTDGGAGDDITGLYALSSADEVSGPFAFNPTNPANTLNNTAPAATTTTAAPTTTTAAPTTTTAAP